MTQENVEVVRRVTDVMDAEGFAAALPVFLNAAHPDVESREDPAWPGSAAYRGVEQVRQVILDRMATLDFDQQTEDLIDVDDKVVVLVRWVGRGKASGAQGENLDGDGLDGPGAGDHEYRVLPRPRSGRRSRRATGVATGAHSHSPRYLQSRDPKQLPALRGNGARRAFRGDSCGK